MKPAILRSIHLLFSVPIIGYIYSPFEKLPDYAPTVRYVAIPALVLTGLWMWQSRHLVGLVMKNRSASALGKPTNR